MKTPAFVERWRVRRSFAKYASPEVIKAIATPHPLVKDPEHRHFQFVIVQIDESAVDDVSALLGKVIDACFRHGAIVSNVSVTLVISYMGPPFEQHDSLESRLALVDDLLRENPNRLRVVHGACNGLIGNFGVPQRSTWGALIPNFSGILRALLDAPQGTAIEIS